jgi:hypothetical protein
MTRRERLEKKLERRREWAEKATTRASEHFDTAHRIGDRIPMGQPVLSGHHSETHHRRDLERIDAHMGAGVANTATASYHIHKADGLEHQLDHNIFSDDDNAVNALKERIIENEKVVEHYVAVNKAYRKVNGNMSMLLTEGLIDEAETKEISYRMSLCHWIKQPYDTTNIRARIRSDKQRIEEINARVTHTEQAKDAGGLLIQDKDSGYISITFAEKPERSVLTALKAAGFWWNSGSWHGKKERLPAGIGV